VLGRLDSISFYDRLDEVLKTSKLHPDNHDSSFNWMVGTWTIQAKGWAHRGSGYNDRYDWGYMISEGWNGDRIEFNGAISVSGIRMIEREPRVRLSDEIPNHLRRAAERRKLV
jgi:hypothetical protein